VNDDPWWADNFSAEDSELQIRRLCAETFCSVTSNCLELVVDNSSFLGMFFAFSARICY